MNILIIILAYLIGSTPSALIIGKLFYKGQDIRESGSGNLGSTNMLRTLGIKAALSTAAFDIFVKGSLTTFIAVMLFENGQISIFPYSLGLLQLLDTLSQFLLDFVVVNV